MQIFTIGFTRKSAEDFFGRIRQSGARRLVDVRLNNVSQLAGFAKREDLRYFTRALCGIPYAHRPDLAPTQPMLDLYKKQGGSWDAYAPAFTALMAERRIERLDKDLLDGACLLCSEDRPHHCHRRLVADYLKAHWTGVDIVHL